MSNMTTGMIVFGVVFAVYGMAAVLAPAVGRRMRPQEAVPMSRRLAGRESDAARRLMDGSLERAAYHASMAALAAQDAAEHPLDVPKLRQ
ncbi:hypothetical protein AB0K00_19315 [Dactylosporangium sp. NPDC049525]|uniref:hypothetical protein n=1 Tax=Dactylosporangium sp. NPDC049525 TaxID=3154730 RepID=UPI0034121063